MPIAINLENDFGIKDVWQNNLDDEFHNLRCIISKYNFIAMDTEFPGIVAKPLGDFKSTAEYQYQVLRTNVDLLKIIQVGLTFCDENGESPEPYATWQFNFKFKLSEDMYAQDSIDLLQNSGINFKKHEESGIEVSDFAELLITSGIVLNEHVRWISFHSGYDFGYMMKMILPVNNLPVVETDFFEYLNIYFPKIYDIKYLMKSCRTLKGGLQEVADELEVDRVGPQHQAGSDSKLTADTFFKMRESFFENHIDDEKYCGHLYGLGVNYQQPVGGGRVETHNHTFQNGAAIVNGSRNSTPPPIPIDNQAQATQNESKPDDAPSNTDLQKNENDTSKTLKEQNESSSDAESANFTLD